MCHTTDHNLGGFYIPSLSKVLEPKIACLSGKTRDSFQTLVADYDKGVEIQFQAIHGAIKEIVRKQECMRKRFGFMIDDVLRHGGGLGDDGGDVDEPPQVGQDDNMPGDLCLFYFHVKS